MKLSLKNIAKVEKGDIELNSISVIAGYNGTGKSTISRALYTTLHVTRNLGEKVQTERLKSIKYVAKGKLHPGMDNEQGEVSGTKAFLYAALIELLDFDETRFLTENELVEKYGKVKKKSDNGIGYRIFNQTDKSFNKSGEQF